MLCYIMLCYSQAHLRKWSIASGRERIFLNFSLELSYTRLNTYCRGLPASALAAADPSAPEGWEAHLVTELQPTGRQKRLFRIPNADKGPAEPAIDCSHR
jgi:hypothetical protein